MKSLAKLGLIALISSTLAVAVAQSLLAYHTPQIPPITSEWQRPDWTAALVQAKDYLKGFNITEKITLVTGVGWQNCRCIGNIPAIPNQNFPGLCLEDSPTAVRFADRVSIFPGGVTTAATFDRRFMRARGEALGREFRGKGVHIALGPMMNMGRVPEGGRNFEGFGADPYLAGEAAFETIVGIQNAGVQACAKHYINNEQEHGRRTTTSNVDDRNMSSICTLSFGVCKQGLQALCAPITSVSQTDREDSPTPRFLIPLVVNDTYACDNDNILNGLLKTELGFEGYVMSDWWAAHSTESAMHGLDMTMPGNTAYGSNATYFGHALEEAVAKGVVAEARVNDMAERIIAAWFLLGQDRDFPEVNFDAFNSEDPFNQHVDVQEDHNVLIRDMGAAGTVLLKNVNGTLPLLKPRSIVLVGSDNGPAKKGPNGYSDRAGIDGILAQGWGSGTGDYPYLISPLEAMQHQARRDHTSISWWLNDWDTQGATAAVRGYEYALVFIAANSGEEYINFDGNQGDRKNLTAWNNGDDLVTAVASHNNNTIVIVHSTGPILMPWASHENVTAILWAGVQGQEAGNSLADILYGTWNPSGRLPFTIAKQESDYGARIQHGEQVVAYTEGLNVDYRWFDAHGVDPLFEFGYGLSYTAFEYFGLEVEGSADDGTDEGAKWKKGEAEYPPGTVGASVRSWLHKPLWTVNVHIKNTGSRYGGEIPQLYIGFPKEANSPPRVLKGFHTVHLQPDETKVVTFELSRYDLSTWDVIIQAWVAPAPDAEYTLYVGRSSRNLQLTGVLRL